MEAAVANLGGQVEAGEEADLGTALHALAQQAVVRWSELGMPWGDTIALACNKATADGIDDWSVTCLQRALEFVRDLIKKYEIEPDNVLTEQWLDMSTFCSKRGGTADLVLIIPFKTVIVCDYKFGFINQGDADEHDQSQTYAIAAAATYKVQEVITFLIQPRSDRDLRYSGAIYDAAALQRGRSWTEAVVARARADDPELVPGYAQCIYCGAGRRCAPLKEFIMRVTEAAFLLGLPEDADKLGETIGAAKLADKWSSWIIDEARQKMIDGKIATGWKLGKADEKTTITNAPEAFEELEKFGLKTDAIASISMSHGKLNKTCQNIIKRFTETKADRPSVVADKGKGKADASA